MLGAFLVGMYTSLELRKGAMTMKRIVGVLLFTIIFLSAGQTFACHISFDAPAPKDLKVGDVITIEAIVEKEHRRCVLPDNEVFLELSESLKLLDDTGWHAEGGMEIRNTLILEVVAESETTVRVFRECSKKGVSEGILSLS
jgi:hypothetical protein